MEGFKVDEVIINRAENFEEKLNYYKRTYNNNGTHKFAKGISISDIVFGNSFAEIEKTNWLIY